MFSENSATANKISLPGRRQFLQQAGLGFGSLALASLLHQESQAAPSLGGDPLGLKSPEFPGRV